MRLLPESSGNQRILAVALLLIVLLLGYLLFVHFWFVAPHLAIVEQRRDLAEQQHQYAELIKRRPLIEKRLEEVAAFEKGNQAFLSDPDATTAFGDLSDRLKQAVDQALAGAPARCLITGVSPSPNRDPEVYLRVSAAVVMSCETETLIKVLYKLETSNPYLFVDRLSLFRQPPVTIPGSKQPVQASVLGVQFNLSGYLRQPGKAKGTP
jgi:general secretion pathway protein M